jgi:hypothetical protein
VDQGTGPEVLDPVSDWVVVEVRGEAELAVPELGAGVLARREGVPACGIPGYMEVAAGALGRVAELDPEVAGESAVEVEGLEPARVKVQGPAPVAPEVLVGLEAEVGLLVGVLEVAGESAVGLEGLEQAVAGAWEPALGAREGLVADQEVARESGLPVGKARPLENGGPRRQCCIRPEPRVWG